MMPLAAPQAAALAISPAAMSEKGVAAPMSGEPARQYSMVMAWGRVTMPVGAKDVSDTPLMMPCS